MNWSTITDENVKLNCLVELNVIEQVYNLCKTTIVQNAWREREDRSIHGWVIDLLNSGLVKSTLQVTAKSSENLGKVFKLDESKVK